jgi:hypothetical protein
MVVVLSNQSFTFHQQASQRLTNTYVLKLPTPISFVIIDVTKNFSHYHGTCFCIAALLFPWRAVRNMLVIS